MRSKCKRRQSRYAPQWGLERLEDRTLLTGNVVASVTSGGNLLIVGDAMSNQIAVQASASGLQVSSLDGTTTINGASGPFTATGFTMSVAIFMGQGDDVVHVGGATLPTSIPKNLLIDTGNGNDTVEVAFTSIGGSAAIIGGHGNDTLTVGSPSDASAVTIRGNLFIFGGWGSSTIAVFDADISGDARICADGNSDHIQVGFDAGLGLIGVNENATGHVEVGGNLRIDDGTGCGFFGGCDQSSMFGSFNAFAFGDLGSSLTGRGGCDSIAPSLFTATLACDLRLFSGCFSCSPSAGGGAHVAVADVNIGGKLLVHTGRGADEVLVGAAHTPANDTTPFNNLVFGHVMTGGDMKIRTDGGDDTAVLIDLTVGGNTVIDTGCGNDHIGVLDSNATFHGNVLIDSGTGNDAIVLQFNAVLGKFTVDAGCGDDTIWLAADLVQKSVTINGGPGSDSLFQSQGTFPNFFNGGAPVLHSIETTLPDVKPTDAEVVAAFGWLSALLGT